MMLRNTADNSGGRRPQNRGAGVPACPGTAFITTHNKAGTEARPAAEFAGTEASPTGSDWFSRLQALFSPLPDLRCVTTRSPIAPAATISTLSHCPRDRPAIRATAS